MRSKNFLAEIDRIEGHQPAGSGDVDAMIEGIHKTAGNTRKQSSGREGAKTPKSVDSPTLKQVEANDPKPEDKPSDNSEIVLTKEQLEGIISGVVTQAKAEAEQDKEALRREAEAERERANRIEADAAKERANHENLSNFLTGYGVSPIAIGGVATSQSPAVMGRASGENMHPADAFKELESIFEQAPTATVNTLNSGAIEQRDTRHLDRWFREHGLKMMPAIDDFAKKHGLLRGTEAATVRSDLPKLFLEILSSYVRVTHSPAHIWHNFVDMKIDLGKRSGEVVDVPRFARAAGSRAASDWDLTGVAALNTTPQALQSGFSAITVKEWGMGKPGLSGDTNAPISLNVFLNAISVMDMLPIINENLGYNYREYETAQILHGKYAQTGLKMYNKGGEIALAAADLVANDGGQCTHQYLQSVSAEMSKQGIPAFANGKYALIIGQQQLKTLEASLEPRLQIMSKASVAELTRIFEQSSNNSNLSYDGYKGDIGDFMVFVTATLYQGAFSTLTETVAGSPRPIHVGYAIGAHAVGRGQAMGFTVFASSDTDFDRNRKLAWRSYEGFGAIDIHPSLDPVGTVVPQQCRVVELRFTATPL